MKFDEESIINRKRKSKILKVFLFVLFIIILYNIILVGITSIKEDESWNVFGYKAFIITSESMQPKIDIGDVIVIKSVPEEEIKTEDIITFKKNNEQITTHRIINIIEEDGKKQYITKGDNNKTGDTEQITYDKIEGKVTLVIPYLGHIIDFLEDKMVLLIVLLIILIITLIYLIFSDKKEKRRRKRKIENQENKKAN